MFNKTDADTTQDMNENNDERETEKVNGKENRLINSIEPLIFDEKSDESAVINLKISMALSNSFILKWVQIVEFLVNKPLLNVIGLDWSF